MKKDCPVEEDFLLLYAMRYELLSTDFMAMIEYISARISDIPTGTLKVVCSDISYILKRRKEEGTSHLKERDWLDFKKFVEAELSRRTESEECRRNGKIS